MATRTSTAHHFMTVTLISIVTWLSLITTAQAGWKVQPVVLVVGDSLSAHYGFDADSGWVSLLEQRLQQSVSDVSVINASVSGETTAGGLNRLPDLLVNYQPDLVIIQLGANDGFRHIHLTTIRSNLAAMIDLAEAQGTMVMLLGLELPAVTAPDAYRQGFQALYTDLATERETLILPSMLARLGDQPDMMQSDGIHPAAAAQPLITDAVIEALDIWVEFYAQDF